MTSDIGKWLVAAAIGIASCCGSAFAATIDTTATHVADQQSFGQPADATFGQSFIAAGSELTTFSLFLDNRPPGVGSSATLDLRGYVGAWNGTQVTSILFESTTQTMNAAGTLQEFAFTPDISVVPGDEYVAFLSISNLPVQPTSEFGMPLAGDVIAGSFVYLNNALNTAQWTTAPWGSFLNGFTGPFTGYDAWFKASFTADTPAPEPATWAMLLFGFLMTGLALRSRSIAAPLRH